MIAVRDEFTSLFMSGFFEEVQRRKVYRVAAAYIVAAGFLIQIASAAFPAWELPLWSLRLVIADLLIGFPIALLLDFINFRLLAIPLLFLSTTLILWPILRNDHSFAESATIVMLLAFASFLSYLSLTQLSPRIGGRSTHIIFFFLLAASAQILLMSGSQTLGQTALILTAALAGTLPLVSLHEQTRQQTATITNKVTTMKFFP